MGDVNGDSTPDLAVANGPVGRTGSVSVLLNTTNRAPVAGGDSYQSAEDTPLVVGSAGVLGNDSDPDGDTLTAPLVAGPAHGSMTLNSDGSFTYAPDGNYSGADSSRTAPMTVSRTPTSRPCH